MRTPPRARASTTGHSSSDVSFFSRGFRARGFPAVPAVPASLLDGKEGVDGSSPSEGPLGQKNCPPFITGSDFLMDGGVTASYFYGDLAPE